MAAIAAPFQITYGSQAVGGSSGTFQIEGPYTFAKTYDTLDLEFIVRVVASSYADLDNQSNTLEEAFRLRDQTLKIDLDNIDDPDGSSTQTYTYAVGDALNSGSWLNPRSTIEKVGEGDMGFSRSYAIHITGELPSQDVDGSGNYTGLRDISYSVDYDAGGQKTLTVSGVYTATPVQTSPARDATGARENYEDATTGIDVEMTAFFAAKFPNESWELIHEDPDENRVDHTCAFTRTYRELLTAQSQSPTGGSGDPNSYNDPDIRDHTFTMDEVIDEPGDWNKNTTRMREVEVFYECAVVLSQNVTLKNTFESKVRPHIIQVFQTTFQPAVFAVARRRVNYDESRQRLSCSMTLVYQKKGSDKVVEIETTVRYTDTKHHKFTPLHTRNEFAFNVDRGWTDRLRTTTTQAITIGEDSKIGRLGGKGGGMAGGGVVLPRGGGVGEPGETGWVEIFTDRESTPIWVGMPSEQQMLISRSTDVRIEQYFEGVGGG